ncbi:MAG: tetratricopeptide repeat protein [Spartobacteria bacterium]|nr:tetratricopeptide repeat protein [Spartobacteria bacterium]
MNAYKTKETWDFLNINCTVLCNRGFYKEAEEIAVKALQVAKTDFGPDDIHVTISLNNLAVIACYKEEWTRAETCARQALAANIKARGINHTESGNCLSTLAYIHNHLGRKDAAASLYRWALEIREQTLGPDHPAIAVNRENLSDCLA